jgi:multiple sugar transport system substrate-binding protein
VTIVSHGDWNDHFTKLQTALAGGVPPDIARMKDYWIVDFVTKDALTELDAFIVADKLDLKARHGEGRLESTRVGGKTYALPFTTLTLNEFYNEDLLKQFGFVVGAEVRPPTTWEERREYARRMVDRDRGQWGYRNYSFDPSQSSTVEWMELLWQNGGEFLTKDLGRFVFNTAEGVEALQYIVDLIWKDQVAPAPGVPVPGGPASGKIALWNGGCWDIPSYRTNRPDFNFGVAIKPAKKSATVMIQGNNLAMFRESKQREAAWTLMRFMNREESDLAWNAQGGYLPVALANFEKPPFSTDPAWQMVIKQYRRQDTRPMPITVSYQEIMNAIGAELRAAYENKKPVKDALADAQRQAQDILDRARKR